MKTPEHELLLRDVLHEEGYGAFRETVREMSLRELRRGRTRHGPQWLALAASVVLGIGVYWICQSARRGPDAATGVQIVRSVPLRNEQLVNTASHNSIATVRSPKGELAAAISVIRSHEISIGEIIGDEQLLAFFKDRPVALVSLQNGSKTLLLLDGEAP
jgi:hypothetical protein